MSRKRVFLSLALALILSLAISVASLADSYYSDIADFQYLRDSSIESVVTYPGCTSIGGSAFYGCKNIKSVEIKDDSVTSIGVWAFQNCTALESVTFGNSVTTFGDYAFAGCTSLTSLYIPSNVTNLGSAAFYNCTSLESVVFANGIKIIPTSLFNSDPALKEVILPESLEEISHNAFYGCTSLESITIPATVTSISQSAFRECTSLSTIYGTPRTRAHTFALENGYEFVCVETADGVVGDLSWEISEGVLTISGEGNIPNYTRTEPAPWTPYSAVIQKIVIEDGVRVIGNLAFYNLDCAVEIVIPESVKTIGTQFIRGTSIKEVTLPAVKVIKDMAFASADKLEMVIAGESVCDIRGKIFYSETVKVKAPMDSYIANYVKLFDELYTSSATVTLEEVGAAETPVIYFAKVGENCFGAVYEKNGTNWHYEISGAGKMKNFPYPSEKNIALGYYTFTPTYYMNGGERNIMSIKVLDGVTTIGNYAFYKCTKAWDFEFHNGIKSIGRGAFQACAKLKTLTVPASVTKIERTAFNGCTALSEIYIPKGVNVFEDSVFVKCNTEGLTVHTTSRVVIDVLSVEYPEITIVAE